LKASEAAYMAFQGPSLPSSAEAAIAHKAGCSLVGTASLALLYGLRSNEISVLGLAQHVNITEGGLTKKIGLGRVIQSLPNLHVPRAPSQLYREHADLPPTVYREQQVTYHPAREVFQDDAYELVQTAADHIQLHTGALGKTASTTALLIEDDNLLFPHFAPQFSSMFEIVDIPHMPEGVRLFKAQLPDGCDVYLVRTSHLLAVAEGRPLSETCFPIRLLHALGVSCVVFVGLSVSCDNNVNQGDLIIINDHINFSGRNPLFGRNEERWGVRFPDMSDAYDAAIRNLAREIALREGAPVKRAVAGLFVGPLYQSPSDARLAHLCGANVLTTGLVPLVTVARHMCIKAVALSVVVGSVMATATEGEGQGNSAALPLPAADSAAMLACRLVQQLNAERS